MLVEKIVSQCVAGGYAVFPLQPERPNESSGNEGRIRQRAQRGEEDPIPESIQKSRSELQRETGLPRPTGSGKCHHPHGWLIQKSGDLAQFLRAADEGIQLVRQVGWMGRGGS